MEMNGKGDKPRPVDKKKFDAHHDEIRWKSKTSGVWPGSPLPNQGGQSRQNQRDGSDIST
jgi:hypothetical protein